jgi:hypothetical protein
MPAGTMPGPPGSGVTSPAPQEPHSLRDQVCLEITSLDERDPQLVTEQGTDVKSNVTDTGTKKSSNRPMR